MIKPLPGYVLVEPIEDDTKTAKGLYLPDSSKDKPSKGKIVSISPVGFAPTDALVTTCGDLFEKTNPTAMLFSQYSMLNVGVTVIYKKWTNQEVSDSGKEYLLVNFNELLATVE